MKYIIKNFYKIGWLFVWLILMTIWLFPFIWIVMSGFRDPLDTTAWPPKFIFTPTLDGFTELFEKALIWDKLKNSLIIGFSATLLTIIISTPASYALSHLKLKGKTGILFGLLIGRVLPPITLVVPLFLIASKLGQLDTYQTMVLIYAVFNTPFAIWLLRSFFFDIPRSIREAAIVDGCSEWGSFFRVMLPLSMAGIATTAIFTFIACWNEFIFALALTSRNTSTLPILMTGFRTQYGILWGQMGAAAFIASIPIIIFAIIVQRYLVRGITMGALKE